MIQEKQEDFRERIKTSMTTPIYPHVQRHLCFVQFIYNINTFVVLNYIVIFPVFHEPNKEKTSCPRDAYLFLLTAKVGCRVIILVTPQIAANFLVHRLLSRVNLLLVIWIYSPQANYQRDKRAQHSTESLKLLSDYYLTEGIGMIVLSALFALFTGLAILFNEKPLLQSRIYELSTPWLTFPVLFQKICVFLCF